jgi:branched-chain amino acid transport system ATP-binding protein
MSSPSTAEQRFTTTKKAPALECRSLDAGYSSVAVVRDLNVSIPEGRVLAVLGPNGAGKTTSLLTIAGLIPRHGGEVLVDGKSLPSGKPGAASKAGLVLVPDDRSLFTTLTVEENLKAARSPEANQDDVIDLFPALRTRWKIAAGALSGGEQQMLALARALVQRPRVLLIDEMSMGLAPIIVEQLMPVVRRIATDTGAVVVLVEQHVALALEVADEALVLAHGKVVLSGPAVELAKDPKRLEAAYLGEVDGGPNGAGDLPEPPPPPPPPPPE